MAGFEFEFEMFLFLFSLPLVRSENRVCLSRGVQETGATWRAAT
jgi:hypothetical protein